MAFKFRTHHLNKPQQLIIALLIIALVSLSSFALIALMSYKVVALLLLLSVSIIAMLFDILPVLIAATASAFIWNYFFIPPKFTFFIQNPEDLLLFSMYFVIALLNAVLTYKIRQYEKQEQKKEEKENTLTLYNTVLNSLSHELRTPIATIIGASDTLLEKPAVLSEKNKEDLLQQISLSALRLNRQVENLLNLSRLESGHYQLKKDWADINELIHGVCNQLKEFSKTHVIELHIEKEIPLCKIDYGLMEQVLYNLLQNAILYTPEKSTILISAAYKQGRLCLEVEDNGAGFPEPEINLAFDKFYRLKNNKPGGTGLGLSIVKGFVMVHAGEIILENKKSGGAKFCIFLPCEISNLNF